MIIQSLLDTDLYKFTMMQVVLHRFSSAWVKYAFKCRTPGVDLKPFAHAINQELDALCELRLDAAELYYLQTLTFFKPDFIEFLRFFQLNRQFISVQTEPEFTITIEGPWLQTILFEVPVLAIVTEIYYRELQKDTDILTKGRKKIQDKIQFVKQNLNSPQFKFCEFGTRRRFSRAWQREVIERLHQALPEALLGTSNVYFAWQNNLKPIGTMAHEFIQACQAVGPRLRDSQKFAFEKWAQEYRGNLGIALSDTYTLDAFLQDFDNYFCKLYDGARQDSGDPFIWAERVLQHYQNLGIDTLSKTLVFSDSLNFPLIYELFTRFSQRANLVFGIGTHLTNDLDNPPIEIVIKMIECNQQPVAKISDSPGKVMTGDAAYLNYLKRVFGISNSL